MKIIVLPALILICYYIDLVRGHRPYGNFHHRPITWAMFGVLALVASFNWSLPVSEYSPSALNWPLALIVTLSWILHTTLGWSKWMSFGLLTEPRPPGDTLIADLKSRPPALITGFCQWFCPKGDWWLEEQLKVKEGARVMYDCSAWFLRFFITVTPAIIAIAWFKWDYTILWFALLLPLLATVFPCFAQHTRFKWVLGLQLGQIGLGLPWAVIIYLML